MDTTPNRYSKKNKPKKTKKKRVKVLNVIIWTNTKTLSSAPRDRHITSHQAVMSNLTSKPCQCSCGVSTSWSQICSGCSVESASHGRSPVRPERKCVFSGSRQPAWCLNPWPLTLTPAPCSSPLLLCYQWEWEHCHLPLFYGRSHLVMLPSLNLTI